MDMSAALTPNNFSGSDIERINLAITASVDSGQRVVIPRMNQDRKGTSEPNLWLIDSAILLPGGVTVELDGCRIKMSDRCRDNIFRASPDGTGTRIRNIHLRGTRGATLEGADNPRATGDLVKKLGEQSYGTDAGVAGESQTGDARNIGIRLCSVDHFSIENLAIHDSHAWAISIEDCTDGILRDLHFESSAHKTIGGESRAILNQDGIDLRNGCSDILIENITGHTGDDLIALTALVSRTPSHPVANPGIRNIIIRNVRGSCQGGHNIIRLLNAPGLPLHDILIDGVIDTSRAPFRAMNAIKIGDATPRYGGPPPLGETARIVINNLITRATNTIMIQGSLADSIVSNVIKHDSEGDVICYHSGLEWVRNLQVHRTL